MLCITTNNNNQNDVHAQRPESKIKSDQGLLNVSAIQFRPAGLSGQFISVKLAKQRMDVLHSLSYHNLGN